MTRKLTITVSDEVYEGLHEKIGARRISAFIDRLARPYVTTDLTEALYREAAGSSVREAEAEAWDALSDDGLSDEAWPDAPR
jgi:predicted CopG family antitoxin